MLRHTSDFPLLACVAHFFQKMKFKGLLIFLIAASAAFRAGAADFVPQRGDVVVAADGTGNVRSVQEAIDKVPVNNSRRFTIYIKPGIYNEQLRIPANKPYITFLGDSAEKTVLQFSISNKQAGSTSAAYATYIGGHDFHAENITFENSFGIGSQAVAMLAEADRLVFQNCRFLGWQDTLYAKGGRQYYKDCYIEGHVDFIFGQAAAVFDSCDIHSKGDGFIAAPMRFSETEPSGYVFVRSRLTGTDTKNGVMLGRPWRAYGRTVYLYTEMGAHIRPEGWNNWSDAKNEKTAYFAEYGSTGPGWAPDKRVGWMHRLTKEEAAKFETANFLGWKDGWNPEKAGDRWLEKTPVQWKLVSWREAFDQAFLWYATDEAARIADQVVLYQKENGGWEKNFDVSAMITQKERTEAVAKKADLSETTIDNGATWSQVKFLAKVNTASLTKSTPPTNFPKHKEAFYRGLDYVLSSQYENGGFPQFFPLKPGYYTHITYNDDAMVGVLTLLDDIARKKPDYAFVDENHRARAERAVKKGIDVILKTQVVVNGKKTVWCAQHDEATLAPAPARTYELVSLSGYESVGIARFLMSIENPSAEVRNAIESAVRWFESTKLTGIKVMDKPDAKQERGYDRVVVKDKNAPPLWARFYGIETGKPIFSGRDGVIKDSLAEIEAERRNGYRWYVSDPAQLLAVDYPAWKKRQQV
jgi:PelA/Pel-15E family pectate lyase